MKSKRNRKTIWLRALFMRVVNTIDIFFSAPKSHFIRRNYRRNHHKNETWCINLVSSSAKKPISITLCTAHGPELRYFNSLRPSGEYTGHPSLVQMMVCYLFHKAIILNNTGFSSTGPPPPPPPPRLPAWWASWLPWWPLAQYSNVLCTYW